MSILARGCVQAVYPIPRPSYYTLVNSFSHWLSKSEQGNGVCNDMNIMMISSLSCYINSLGDALAQLGHKIYCQPTWNMAELEAGLAHARPDMLITVCNDQPFEREKLIRLAELCDRYSLFHLCWTTEDKIHFDRVSLPYVRLTQPDLIWTIHPDCVEMYQNMGFDADYCNFFFNPRLFPAKPANQEERFDVAFVGTTHLEPRTFRHDSLKQLLFPLIRAQVQVHVWGHHWLENQARLAREFGVALPADRFHGYLPYKQTASIYHQSKIVLGVQNARDQVTQRTFEILGTGAFMLASRTEALEQLFQDEKELILSSSPEETIELVRFYSSRPDLRRVVGARAREKVLKEHRFDVRLAPIWPKAIHKAAKKRRVRE